MDEKIKNILEIIFGILIGLLVLLFQNEIAALGDLGYVGVFLALFLSAATIIFPAPGWVAVITAVTLLGLNPYLVGIVAGVGSGLGEITGYMVGNGATGLSSRKFNEYKEAIKKYGSVAIFLLAFLPNPFFDVAGLLAGALKIPVWKFLLACVAGRTFRYVLLAYLGMLAVQDFLF